MKSGGNFLTAHYEWIVAAVAAAALIVGVVMFIGAMGADPDAAAQDQVAVVKNIAPTGEKVAAADLTDFTRTSKVAKAPTRISEVTDDKASFLASERRIYCGNDKCRAAVPGDAKVCPVCKFEFKEEVKVVIDADGDGLPDVWEKKYGFNTSSAADAALDADSDGFTNLEEFEAKTDPTDRNDHPDYLDSLKLQLPLAETKLPFYFVKVMPLPGGVYRFYFTDPQMKNDYGKKGRDYSAKTDEEIGKTGFIVKKYEHKTIKREIAGDKSSKRLTRDVDVSTATIERKSDGKQVVLALNERGKPVDVQARLLYMRGTPKTFTVVPGDALDLNGSKYTVKDVRRTEKGAEVTLEDAKGKTRVVTAP